MIELTLSGGMSIQCSSDHRLEVYPGNQRDIPLHALYMNSENVFSEDGKCWIEARWLNPNEAIKTPDGPRFVEQVRSYE